MPDILSLIILILMVLFATIVIPQIMIYRSIPAVIQKFRDHNAVSEAQAQSVDSLGLGAKPIFSSGGKTYQPKALQVLLKAEIVMSDENGAVYLNEEEYAKSRLGKSESSG